MIMRVLHVIPSLSLAHGGPTRALALMEQALAAQGVEVETATSDDDGPRGRLGRPLEVPVLENGVIRRYFPRRTVFYKASPALGRWLALHVRDYDLVHIHALFSYSSIAAARAARRAGVPYVLRPLGTLAGYGVKQRRPWLKRASLALFEEPALRSAAAVHFTSEEERTEAEAWGIPMRSRVVPLGVEPLAQTDGSLARQRYPALGEEPYLLYLSRLDPKKNLEGLLDAWAEVAPQFPAVQLMVAGGGEPSYAAALRARAAARGLAARVVWAGAIDGEIKASAFAGAWAFVLPSFSENFGIAAAEALMAGLPCVLGRGVAIAAEVEAAGAGWATPPDAPQVAEALRRALALSSAQRHGMARAARELAQQRYSAQAMGRGLVSLYREILGA
jgi:glycosyltransferase involved in cell wall biosynthesis